MEELILTPRKRKRIAKFFPEGCQFYWNGKGYPPDQTILLFHLRQDSSYCDGCDNEFYCECNRVVRSRMDKKSAA
jgi:hypothetical protein